MQLQSKPKPPQLQPRKPHLLRNQSQQSRLQSAQARVKPEVELTRVISLTWWSSLWVTQLMPHSIMRLIDWRGWWRSTWPTCRVLSRGTWWTWWGARWCPWCWPTCRIRLVTSQHFCFRYSAVNQLSSLLHTKTQKSDRDELDPIVNKTHSTPAVITTSFVIFSPIK